MKFLRSLYGTGKNRFVFASLLILIFFVLASSLYFTFAQVTSSNQSLEVTPPTQDIQTDPGKTVSVKAKIRNKSGNTLPVSVRIEDFTSAGEEGQVELIDKGPYTLASWAVITPDTLTLAPGEQKEVIATITIPPDVAGGRYGSFVFSISGAKTGGAASVAQEIASLFLVRISGPVSEQLAFETFIAPQFSEFGPIPFSMKFKNSGNVHVKAVGLINVTNMFGQKVSDIVVTGTNIFPGSSRILSASLNKQFLIGSYNATAIIYYGAKNQTLTALTSFFVFPVRIAAGVVIVLLALYLMRKRILKAFKALMG